MKDVFVIGGGPAGLAAAIAVRKRGFQVAVADPRDPPIDKPCGEGLLPDAVEALCRLGVELPHGTGCSLSGVRFLHEGKSAEARFPSKPGLGVPRTALHDALAAQASASGVELRWRARIRATDDGTFLGQQRIRASWIVGADGANSVIRRWSGLDHHSQSAPRFAFRTHFRLAPWTGFVEVYWGSGMQVYVTPIGKMEVCVAVVSHDPRTRLSHALFAFPALAARLRAGEPISAERGAITRMLKLRRVCSHNLALIGDASGCVDAVTGEGLGLAFRQAIVLADAIAAGNLALYEAGHRKLMHRPFFMGHSLLLLDRHEGLRRRVINVFETHSQVFARCIAAHVGGLTKPQFALTGANLGWHLLGT
ncbi:MAG TPA: FAD-dependent monooxygenase [Candidatus Acidoferrum sp.]|nr:FAD-dependent monooxygenase [Candidatus Acidoferrum sp.]